MSKILIVEDEESIADLEKDYLELSGFEVEVANDGQTGLDKVVRFVRKRIHRSSWYLRKKMISTRSEDSDLGLMTI